MSQKRSNTIFLVIKHPVKSYKNLQIEKLPSFAFQKTKQTNNVANHEALSIRTKKKKNQHVVSKEGYDYRLCPKLDALICSSYVRMHQNSSKINYLPWLQYHETERIGS